MKTNFFYSKSTGLYISRTPLKIDSRVKKATEKSNIKLHWDDEGRINLVSFDDAKNIVHCLGSTLLGPIEYRKALHDAQEEGDEDMVKELTSDAYCERLDRIYLIDKTRIDHPKMHKEYTYSGSKEKSIEPDGRPGWFTPENNIDFALGLPKKITLFREKFATSRKYWSADFSVTAHRPRAIIRGYVTSVGKPSFDQGIPVDSRQPMVMIRECRKKPLESPIPEKILQEATQLLQHYNEEEKNNTRIISFVKKYGKLFKNSKQITLYKIRESFFNILGAIKLQTIAAKNDKKIKMIDAIAEQLRDKIEPVTYNDFVSFVQKSTSRLKNAIENKKDIVFVMGHKNPDTDTVISCLCEAWRNHILDKGSIAYIPIVQNHKIPDEVRALLGNEISDHILLHNEKIYIQAKESGLARWISVDQNREPDVQKYFISIIDHHIPSEISQLQDIPKTMKIIGSCTALIVQKMIGIGIYPDKKIAKILHGATLMDTENRVGHKMTTKDILIMNYLKDISEIHDENIFYGQLMSFLLNTDDPNILFGRDYKEDRGFGFAVAKIKKGFIKNMKEEKKIVLTKTIMLARQNNIDKNLPLTLVKITDYQDNNIIINKERIYLVFNDKATKEFISAIFNVLENIIKFEFGKVHIKTTSKFIEFRGTGMQLSRKKTAPILEPAVKVFNEYFYSPSNKLWIKRDFLKKSNDLIYALKKEKLHTSFDKEKKINYLTYPEAKILANNLKFTILSLKEYWLALRDAKKIKDIQMMESLQGSNFVEFLDTVFKDYKIMIEHPRITKKGAEYSIEGKKTKVNIPKGKPGLIHPDAIDLKTGIPKEVRPPSEYGNQELWRYREPDSELVNPTRSYIFLLKQPCRDGKFHINDSLPNLGIRPCCKKVNLPQVNIITNKKKLIIKITKEGDIIRYTWGK